MQPFAGFGEFLITALVVFGVAVFVGVVCLWIAIAVYNLMVGGASSPKRIAVPEFEKLALIIFLTACLTAVMQVIVWLIVRRVMAIGAAAGLDGREAYAVAQLICLPLSLLVMAKILSAQLPTTFTRAMIVTLFSLPLTVAAVVVLLVIASALFEFLPRGA